MRGFGRVTALACLLTASCAKPPPLALSAVELSDLSISPAQISNAELAVVSFTTSHAGNYVISTPASVVARGALRAPGAVALTVPGGALPIGVVELRVTVFADAGGRGGASGTLTVARARARLVAKPTAVLELGTRFVGATATGIVFIENEGQVPAVLGPDLVGGSGPLSAVFGTCGSDAPVGPGESCTVRVEHVPSVPGPASSSFLLSYDDGVEMQTLSFSANASAECAPPDTAPTVVPHYGAIGEAWLSHVRTTDETQACNATTDLGPLACIHAGERRRVELPNVPSCAGIVVQDTLDAFEWRCVSGAPTFVFSTRLNPGRGLANLLAADGKSWNNNSVSVQNAASGCALVQTPPARWWSNPVRRIVSPVTDGTTEVVHSDAAPASAIVTVPVDTTTSTNQYINSSTRALVVYPGATLTLSGAASVAASAAYAWVEGDYALSSVEPIAVSGRKQHLVNLTSRAELRLTSSRDVRGRNVKAWGVGTSSALRARFVDLVIAPPSTWSTFNVAFEDLDGSVFHRMSTSGVFLNVVASSIVMTQLYSVSGSRGAILDGAYETAAFVTAANHGGSGGNGGFDMFCDPAAPCSAAQILSANNTNSGLLIGAPGGAGLRLARVATAHNGGPGITIQASGASFFGGFWAGSNGGNNCESTGSGNSLASNCSYGAGPIAPSSLILDLTQGFVGNDVSDAQNAHGGAAPLLATAISDWTEFERPSRYYGRSAPFPGASARTRCDTAQTCAIWDVALSAASPLLGVGGTFTAGAACPASVDATNIQNVMTDIQLSAPNVFLLSAIEIVDDFDDAGHWIGDEDGLCESNERCIFAPNIGAYQGHGPLTSETCVFSGGNGVENVAIFAHTHNGGWP